MCITIRAARPADATAIAATHSAAIRVLGPRVYAERVVEAWGTELEPARYPIGADHAYVVVAIRCAELAGFGDLRYEAEGELAQYAEGEIRGLYVHPAHVRRGVGTRIYEALAATAREHGLESLALRASLAALPFYKVLGFEWRRQITHPFGGSVPGAAVDMAIRL